MPFTISHVAVIIPFNYKPFVLSALIIGCMSPDFLYFIPFSPNLFFTHSFIGLVIYCIPISLAVYYLYNVFLRKPIISLLPTILQTSQDFKSSKDTFLWVLISILIGATSHLIWDSFTHKTGSALLYFDFLSIKITIFSFELYVYKVLQYMSTIIGGLIVMIWIAKYIRQKITKKTEWIYALKEIKSTLVIMKLCTLIGFIYSWQQYMSVHIKHVIVQGVIVSISLCLFSLLIYSLKWHMIKVKNIS